MPDHREPLRARFNRLLQPQAPPACDLSPRVVATTDKGDYIRTKIVVTSHATDAAWPNGEMPMYVLVPKDAELPARAIVCVHQHAGQAALGKSEAAGRIGAAHANYAERYTRAGFVTVAPDMRCFEERREYWDIDQIATLRQLLHGRTMAGMFAYDVSRCVDYLVSRSDVVDAERIGVTGHSMGAMVSLVTAVVEPRIKAVVASCGVSTLAGRFARGETVPAPYLIPGLATLGDLPDVYALIAPRPLMLFAGRKDTTFKFADFEAAYPRLEEAWRDAGAPEKLSSVVEDVGHTTTDGMYAAGVEWFGRWL